MSVSLKSWQTPDCRRKMAWLVVVWEREKEKKRDNYNKAEHLLEGNSDQIRLQSPSAQFQLKQWFNVHKAYSLSKGQTRLI